MGALLVGPTAIADDFEGFDDPDLHEVTADAWGLKIVVFDVGQADAILILAPNGDVCLIDSGRSKAAGTAIADFLEEPLENGVGALKTIDLLYTTHYDQDHIAGLPELNERGVAIRKAFDQGPSKKRSLLTPTGLQSVYAKYLAVTGDPNDNLAQDTTESKFVRHAIHYGHKETMGLSDGIEILCVGVKGDTEGGEDDVANLNPAVDGVASGFDENHGSIALVVRFGDFEFYTAGDQTGDDWKDKPAVEESIVSSDAIPSGNDIDVLKVNHHGSDTSTSQLFAKQTDAEVAVITAKFSTNHRLPKKIALMQLQENRCFVLITGDGKDPTKADYAGAETEDEVRGALPSATSTTLWRP